MSGQRRVKSAFGYQDKVFGVQSGDCRRDVYEPFCGGW